MSEPSEYRLAFERLGEILCSLERAPTATDIRRLRAVIDSYGAAARAEGDQAGYERGQRRVASLFDAIAHGDEAHRAWLQQAIEDHFAGRFVQKPAGEGGYERGRRDTIEECAKIAARYNDNRVATAIRALAEPAPQQASQPQEQSA